MGTGQNVKMPPPFLIVFRFITEQNYGSREKNENYQHTSVHIFQNSQPILPKIEAQYLKNHSSFLIFFYCLFILNFTLLQASTFKLNVSRMKQHVEYDPVFIKLFLSPYIFIRPSMYAERRLEWLLPNVNIISACWCLS